MTAISIHEVTEAHEVNRWMHSYVSALRQNPTLTDESGSWPMFNETQMRVRDGWADVIEQWLPVRTREQLVALRGALNYIDGEAHT